MRAMLRIKHRDGSVVEEEVKLKGVEPLDAPSKLEAAARKLIAPRNKDCPTWAPKVVLLGVRPMHGR